jgi:hypothetical protein
MSSERFHVGDVLRVSFRLGVRRVSFVRYTTTMQSIVCRVESTKQPGTYSRLTTYPLERVLGFDARARSGEITTADAR